MALWAHNYYDEHRALPGLMEGYEAFKHRKEITDIVSVARAYDNPIFRHYLLKRGVPWVRYDNKGRVTQLTSEQLYVLAYIMDPTNPGNLKSKLLKLGYQWRTWQTWMKQPEFARAVERISDEALRDMMPHVQNALIRQAEKGDMNAIKFVYQITGTFDPDNKAVVDVMAVLSRVVEVITKHVDDPVILAKIGGEIQMLANTALSGRNMAVTEIGNAYHEVKAIQAR